MSAGDPEIEVSIVVPAYNQASLLERLLDSLVALKSGPHWEVLIVDDCSTDDTAATTARWLDGHPEVRGRYLLQDRNQGPGAARNRGLAEAQGALVAFIDTDCIAGPDWLAALLSGLTDEHIVGVGGAVRAFNPENRYARYNTVNGTLQPIVAPDYAIPYLVTCNCCYRRDALRAVGGFPTDIARPGGEDVAASIALYKQGYRFAFAPDATIAHDFRDTWRRFARTWQNYGYGCGLTAHRMLTQEELNPEWGQWGGNNYWGVQAVRPTVTGIRSCYRDLRWFRGRCRERGVKGAQLPIMLLLRLVERLCYLRGWRAGVKRAHAERGLS